MLIKCPECGKEISDKADVCIGCGYPINKKEEIAEDEEGNPNVRNINGRDIDITQVILLVRNREKIKAIKELRDISGLGLKEAKDMVDSMECDGTLQSYTSTNDNATTIRCPKCGSIQIQAFNKGFGLGKAVTGGVLLGGVGLLGGFIGSKKVMVGCLNCGHKWKAGK